MSTDSVFKEEYDEASGSGKLSRKVKESPFMPVGIAGLIFICGFGAYKFRHRGQMTTSMFLMQLRVTAQGAVVGALTCGIIYSMAQQFMKSNSETTEPKHK